MRYSLVPKERGANLRYRRELLRRCLMDKSLRAGVREACRTDLLFWINSFAWAFEPRKQTAFPFITYPFQDQTIRSLHASLGREDVLIEKSRDMGATWMCLLLFLHQWMFRDNSICALVSAKQDLVDAPGDPDTLFWKLRYTLQHQPEWLLPRYRSTELNLTNLDNGSSIDGYGTTGNVLRGGRKTAALLDEFASFEQPDGYAALAATQAVTDCRIFNSTPQGATGAFYDLAHGGEVKKLTLHWSTHPEKARGLYADPVTGKPRSPWYDKECRRTPVPALIAQELDIDYAGSASMFFPSELIDRLITGDAREPYVRGRLEFDPARLADAEPGITFLEDPKGDLMLWMYPKPPEQGGGVDGEYVVGADISAGTGATNSVLAGADRRTGEKVVELASAHLSPDRFAECGVALCRWLNGAYFLWENNGPGGPFGKRVMDLGYRNVYWRQDEQGLRRKLAEGQIPGWHASRDNKRVLFSEYVAALAKGRFINRSRAALEECRQYVYQPDGSVGNARSRATADPSAARENHGDRPTADALACKGLREVGVESEEEAEDHLNPPEGSFAWRRKQREEALRRASEW